MVSESQISDELIFKAADQLLSENISPTNETVRAVLAKWTDTKGGSYAVISPALRAWKARRKAAELIEPLREAAPQAITDKTLYWAADIWAMAVEQANTRLTADREALAAVRAELDGEMVEALALAEKREDERDEARRALVEQAEKASQVLNEARDEVKQLSSRAATAESKVSGLELRIAELLVEVKSERQLRAAAEKAATEATVALGRLQGETEALRKQVASQETIIRSFSKS